MDYKNKAAPQLKHASHSGTDVACRPLPPLVKRLHQALQACCRYGLARVLTLPTSLPMSRSMRLCRPGLQVAQP